MTATFYAPSASEPTYIGTRAVGLTKSDSTEFTYLTRALYVGGTGDVCVYMPNDAGTYASVVFYSVPAGTFVPVQCSKLMSTGTSATNVVGIW